MKNNVFDFNELNKTSLTSLSGVDKNSNYENNVETWNNAKNTVNNLRSIFEEHNITGQIVENVDNLYKFIDTHKPAKYITTTISDVDLRTLHGACTSAMHNSSKR